MNNLNVNPNQILGMNAQMALAIDQGDDDIVQQTEAERVNATDTVGPFWGANDNRTLALSTVDRTTTNIRVEGWKIAANRNAAMTIEGLCSETNNSRAKFDHVVIRSPYIVIGGDMIMLSSGSDGDGARLQVNKNKVDDPSEYIDQSKNQLAFPGSQSFENYLRNGKGSILYHTLKDLYARGKIVVDSDGYRIDVSQSDSFDAYSLFVDLRVKDKEYITNMLQSSSTLSNEPIYKGLQNLVNRSHNAYDSYVFILLTMFNWFEEVIDNTSITMPHRLIIRKGIDDFINEHWHYGQEVSLHEFRGRCILSNWIFIGGIIDTINNAIAIAITSADISLNSFPERRDVNRLIIRYDTTNLYDDWTIFQLTHAFIHNINSKHIIIRDSTSAIENMVRAGFFVSNPVVGRAVEMTLQLELEQYYSLSTLQAFGIQNISLSDRLVMGGTFTVSLRFDGCVTNQRNDEPRLTYIIKRVSKRIDGVDGVDDANTDAPITGTVRQLIKFNHNAVFEAIKKWEEDDNNADHWIEYTKLLAELKTITRNISKESPLRKAVNNQIRQAQRSRKMDSKRHAFLARDSSDSSDDEVSSDSSDNDITNTDIEYIRIGNVSYSGFGETGDNGQLTIYTRELSPMYTKITSLERDLNEMISAKEEADKAVEDGMIDVHTPISPTGTNISGMTRQLKKAKDRGNLLSDDLLKAKQEVEVSAQEMSTNSGDLGYMKAHQALVAVYNKARADFDKASSSSRVYTVRKSGNLLRSFDLCVKGLNTLDARSISSISLDDERFYQPNETISGLYPHQRQIIEAIGRAFMTDSESHVISTAGVGSGKTTVVLAIAMYMLELATNRGIKKAPLVIYAASSKGLLKDIYGRAQSLKRLKVLAMFHRSVHRAGGRGPNESDVIFRIPGAPAKRSREPTMYKSSKELETADMVVCHVRTLVYLLGLLEKMDNGRYMLTGRPYVTIIDEIDPKGMNSETEHALGAALAIVPKAPRRRNMAIFSASAKPEGPVRYFMNHNKNVQVIGNTNILVPTELRDIHGKLLDPLMGSNDKHVIRRINEEGFYRRFISKGNIDNMVVFGNDDTADVKFDAVRESTRDYLKRARDNGVLDFSTIFGLYQHHNELREYLKSQPYRYEQICDISFKISNTWIDDIPDLVRGCDKVGDAVITALKGYTVQKRGDRLTVVQARALVKYIEFYLMTGHIERHHFANHLQIVADARNKHTNRITEPEFTTDDINDAFANVGYSPIAEVFTDFENWQRATFSFGAYKLIQERKIAKLISEYSSTSTSKNCPLYITELLKRYEAQDADPVDTVATELGMYCEELDADMQAYADTHPKFKEIIDCNVPHDLDLVNTAQLTGEVTLIKTTPYYAMVGCTAPAMRRATLYYSLAYELMHLIINFYKEHFENLGDDRGRYSRDDEKGMNNAKEYINEFNAYQKRYNDAIGAQVADVIKYYNHPIDGKKPVMVFWEYMVMLMQDKGVHHTGYIGKTPLDDIRKHVVRSDVPNMSTGEEQPTGTPQLRGNGRKDVRDRIRKGIIDYARMCSDRASTAQGEVSRETRDLINGFVDVCNVLIRRFGFTHQESMILSRESIINIGKRGDIELVYEAMKVYEATTTQYLPSYKANRLFCNVACARGIDLPLEAVIFTKDYEDNQTSDDILQMSGRCGRPSKSVISVVYMSPRCYSNTVEKNDTKDITNAMFRMKFQLQSPQSTSVYVPLTRVPIAQTRYTELMERSTASYLF